jgi:hypothetical protein
MELRFHGLFDARLNCYRLWLFGWCLDDCHAFLLFLLYGFVLYLSYDFSDSFILRGQNTSCEFQQQEAGVTPEARRDRAAILRHDGVAPASDRVLAALRFLAVSVASACSFSRLSPCQGDAGGEISGERCLLGTFHSCVYWLMRVPLEQRRLSVHSC